MAIGVLEHIGIVVKDIESARHIFRNIFSLPEASYPSGPDGPAYAYRAGATVIRVVTPQAPEAAVGSTTPHHLTFSVDSLSHLKRALQEAGISVLSTPAGPGGLPAIWADPADTINIPLQFVEQSEKLEFPPAPADSFIERVDHLGVACWDNRKAQKVYVEKLDFSLDCIQTDAEILVPIEIQTNDKYGTLTFAHPPINRVGLGLHVLFLTVGEFELEIMQPLGEAKLQVPLGTIPGSVGQDQGAIARYLERRGEGLSHIGFKTLDMQRALDTVAKRGVKLIDSVGRRGGRGGLIGFMDVHSTGGMLFHFAARTPL